jgi:D-threo-aldose 1-dehydrogenase
MDAAQERGVSVLAAAPYNSGLLAAPWPSDDAHFNYASAPADMLASARRWAGRAEEHGVTLPDLALQFPLQHPATASVVVGLRTPGEVTAAAERAAKMIPEAVWTDAVS